MSKIIVALVVSVDGFIEGPHGALEWVDSWDDAFDRLPQIDTCILGRGMYPGDERYGGAILANPEGILPFTGQGATKGEIAYARVAERTPPLVVSRTLDQVAWTNTRMMRDVEAIRRMQQQPGKDRHAVGGATLVGRLMKPRVIDELRLVVHPIILGGGQGAVQGRHGAACVDVAGRQAVTVGLGPSDVPHITWLKLPPATSHVHLEGSTTMRSTTERTEIEALFQRLARAHVDHDADAIVESYAPDAVIYDLAPPLGRRGMTRDGVATWLAGWDGPILIDARDVSLIVDGDLACVSALHRMRGRQGGEDQDLWFRTTMCLRKMNGEWRIVHDHSSVPFYMDGSYRAAVDLKPS